MEQEELLRTIAAILGRLKIPYVVTGGMAVAVWGRPRFTADIDIVVELVAQKLDQLARALLQIDKDVYVDSDTMKRALGRKGEFNFIHPASGLKVDFWVSGQDQFSKLKLKRRIPKQFGRQRVYFVSPEDLILSKLLWHKEGGSDYQLEDIASILRIQTKLNRPHLKKWASVHSTLKTLQALWKEQRGGLFA